ncbi:peroxiredoxin-like family protein [Paraburkholderia sp. 2C]|jgi:alkyl-hydroperoxide reductase/thiol specific antioxidant family protein
MHTLHNRLVIEPGHLITGRQLFSLNGVVALPDPNRLIHLQFRRFAGCPACDLHLHSIAKRHGEIVSAGIREVAVFHTAADDLRPFTVELPFEIIADPDKRLYAAFGVEASPRALLSPQAWLPILRGVLRSLGRVVFKRQPVTSFHPEGGKLGLPADFLIDIDGRVLACKYGKHLYDQWSVDDLLSHARTRR